MIKVEKTNNCSSYWRGDSLYDNEHEKETKIKIFNLTIWHRKQIYKCDLKDDLNKNGVGFKR